MSTDDKIKDALKTDLKKRNDMLENLTKNMHQINKQLDKTIKWLDEPESDNDSDSGD